MICFDLSLDLHKFGNEIKLFLPGYMQRKCEVMTRLIEILFRVTAAVFRHMLVHVSQLVNVDFKSTAGDAQISYALLISQQTFEDSPVNIIKWPMPLGARPRSIKNVNKIL